MSLFRTKSMHRWLIAVALLAACSSGDDTNTGGNPNGDTFTTSINGTAFNATVTGASFASTNLSVGGQVTNGGTIEQVNLFLFGIDGPGTYTVATQPLNFATYTETTNNNTVSWSTSFVGATGSVTITSLTATKVSGTFSFVAPASTHTGATGTRAATNGSFTVTLQAAGLRQRN